MSRVVQVWIEHMPEFHSYHIQHPTPLFSLSAISPQNHKEDQGRKEI